MHIKTPLLLALAATSLFAAGTPPRKVFKTQPPHPAAKEPATSKAAQEETRTPRFSPRTAAGLLPIAVTIDAKNVRHRIDPNIYGVAFENLSRAATPQDDLNATINRWGGNAVSTHNWKDNVTNRAKDYFFENIPDVNGGTQGEAADAFIDPTLTAGRDALMTIPLLDRTPKQPPAAGDAGILCSFDKVLHPEYLNQHCCASFDDLNRPRCGDGRDNRALSYGDRLFINDPDDDYDTVTSAFQAEWIDHMVGAHGNAATGGVKFYALDNEPSLWSFDHWDMHPAGASAMEVATKMAEYGAMIKTHDPTSLTTGVEEWGWSGFFYSGLDQEALIASGYTQHPDNDQYADFVPFLLKQSRAYEETNGTRILDYLALHYYPQGDGPQTHFEFTNDNDDTTQLLRNRSTRSLWDPAYQDQSWIGAGPEGGIVRLIPRMREWANNFYPGTKIALNEYNWGAEGTDTNDVNDVGFINGATAQADILGILGREGADMAVRWTGPPSTYFLSYPYKAFQMYRNYDGARSTFGDLSLDVAVHDPNVVGPNNPDDISDNVAVFGALRSSDGAMTVMIISKTPATSGGVTRTVNLTLSNFAASGAPIERRELNRSVPPALPTIAHLANLTFASPISLVVNPQTITLLVIPGSYQAAPTNLVAQYKGDPGCSNGNYLTWSGSGASYEIVRRTTVNGASTTFAPVGAATTFCDTNALASNTTYLYNVRAVGAGAIKSGLSNIDAATTISWTHDPLSAGAPISAADVTDLRTAANAMLTAGGRPGATFVDAITPLSTAIKAEQIREIRRAINVARAWIGLSPFTLTDNALTGNTTAIKRQHILDLRNAVN